MELFIVSLLNGLSYGLLLFMLSAGLTLIFSMMGVMNFAHASFYMLGAYVAYSVSKSIGFWPALIVAPLSIGVIGAMVERYGLRAVHKHGHIAELLFTFGLSYICVELVQLVWGRKTVPYQIPAKLDFTLFTIYATKYPAYKAFMMLVSSGMLLIIYLILKKTRVGIIIQAALSHPESVETLGHNVPRVFTVVFATGAALAGLAGVIGGNAFVTEPSMAGAMGSIVFVVVIFGGLGSILGALLASLIIGLVQTYAITLDYSILKLVENVMPNIKLNGFSRELFGITIAEFAPILPYILLVGILAVRPRGLMGNREA